MADASKFTASGIIPQLPVCGDYQRFAFSRFNPAIKLQANSSFLPTTLTDSVINIETRNNQLSGFRWKHTSKSTDTNNFGTFKFQSFISDGAGTDIFGFDGTNFNIYFPVQLNHNLDMGSFKITGLATPTLSTDAATKGFVEGLISAGTIVLTGDVTGSGVVGTPFPTTLTLTLDEIPIATAAVNINSQNIVSVGKLGIGVSNPNIQLQFPNSTADCKLCLYQTVANSFQVYGFGVTSGTLKYTVDSSSSSHVFYCGASSTTSTELFRIAGSGIVTVQNSLNMNTHQINNLAMAGAPAGTDAVNVSYLNSRIAAGTIVLTGDVTGSGVVGTSFPTTLTLTLDEIPIATSAVNLNSQNIVSVGKLGIGVSSPSIQLQFPNATAQCKICLFQAAANSFQVYGFGVMPSKLVYTVDSSSSSHVFYCGASSTTSTELFKIAGTGYATVSGGDGTFYSRVPSAHVSLSGGSSTTTPAGVWTKLNGTTTASAGTVQFTTSSNRITFTGSDLSANCTGMITGSVTLLLSAASSSVQISIFKNGTSFINSSICWGTNTSSASTPISISIPDIMTTLSPGDYLEIWALSIGITITTQYLNLSFVAC